MATDEKEKLKATKRAKDSKATKPISALAAEKQALEEEKAARDARRATVSKAEREANKAKRKARFAERVNVSKPEQTSSSQQQARQELAGQNHAKADTQKAAEASQQSQASKTATKRPAASSFGCKVADKGASKRESSKREETKRERKEIHIDLTPAGIATWADGHRLAVGILVGIIFVFIMLYPPICSYYAAVRTNATLSSQLSDITTDVDALSSDVSKLTSEEGIKDEARRRGYVEDGDVAVEMEGVQDSGSAAADTTVMEDAQKEETETPWYFVALDFIFRYDAETQGVS